MDGAHRGHLLPLLDCGHPAERNMLSKRVDGILRAHTCGRKSLGPGLEMKPPSLGVETTKRRKHHLCHWDPVVPNLRFGGTGVGAMFGSSRAVPEVRYDWIPRE